MTCKCQHTSLPWGGSSRGSSPPAASLTGLQKRFAHLRKCEGKHCTTFPDEEFAMARSTVTTSVGKRCREHTGMCWHLLPLGCLFDWRPVRMEWTVGVPQRSVLTKSNWCTMQMTGHHVSNLSGAVCSLAICGSWLFWCCVIDLCVGCGRCLVCWNVLCLIVDYLLKGKVPN